MSKGYDSLVEKVKNDCNEGEGCFNPNGCDFISYVNGQTEDEMKKSENKKCEEHSKCSHRYCDKFRWIIDRAKHYSDKTGLSWENILDSWEDDCNYWYMNYYQENNQPLIKGEKVKVFDTVNDMLESIGDRKFRCPCCGGISTDPYKCNSGVKIGSETKNQEGKVCDWKVYGLLGDLGKGTYIFCKDKLKGETIFTPISWENKERKETEDKNI